LSLLKPSLAGFFIAQKPRKEYMDQGQDTTTQAESSDLRATLVAALEAPETSQAATDSEPSTTEAPSTDPRPRDELGRFKAKEASEPVSEHDDTTHSVTEVPEEDKPIDPVEEQSPKPATALRAPQSWGASAKAKFAELPPEIQQEVIRREGDYNKGLQRNAELAQFGRSLAEVINPYQAMLAAEGADPITVVSEMMRTAYLLRNAPAPQKVQLFKQVAQQFGVDLASLTAEEPYVDPQIAALQARQQQLEQYLQQQALQAQQQSQYAQAQETSRLTSEIDAFAADPAHPHFEELRPAMAALLKAGLAQDLADAYEQATWTRPDIRSSLLEQQEAKRKVEAAKRAKEAAAAAVSVRGAPHGGPGLPAPRNTLREELEAALSG
jgi:hypothetical protein